MPYRDWVLYRLYFGRDGETLIILRDYIKATDGFEKLGRATGTPPKSLIRMFGPRGNPRARNLFGVLGHLQKRDGLTLRVTSVQKRSLKRAA